MIENGASLYENDNEDFETLTTILTEEDLKEVEISQSHIDEDDEKFFGKDLSFKAIEHQYFTTSVATCLPIESFNRRPARMISG